VITKSVPDEYRACIAILTKEDERDQS
jgi:hypothetical protein